MAVLIPACREADLDTATGTCGCDLDSSAGTTAGTAD